MRWEKLAKTKPHGGLGFRSIKSFNTALLAKQWWRLMSMENSLVTRVLKEVYFRHVPLAMAELGSVRATLRGAFLMKNG